MSQSGQVSPSIARSLHDAAAAQQRGDFGTAQRLYGLVLAQYPAQPIALNALGMIALHRKDPAVAAQWFDRAANADPSAPVLWINRATAARMLDDVAAERASLERALAIDRRDLMANVRLAELLDRIGDEHKAFDHWNGIKTMLAGQTSGSPQLVEILGRAEDRVAAFGAVMARAFDDALAPARENIGSAQRRRVDACVDAMLGRRRIFANEPHGLHFPFLPADEYFARDHFPWLADLEANTAAIRAECEALLASPDAGFEPYVALDPGSPDNLWTPLDGSRQWTAMHLWRHGERVDAVCDRCPATAAALDAIPRATLAGRMPTAFFSILQPHTHLPAHSGVSNVRAIVHLPLIVPPGCRFRVGGETREWCVGEAFVFDDTIEHEAWNDSDAVRAILIFDVWNPHIDVTERAMLADIFTTMNTLGFGASNLVD
jgi:aspartate beta-hydroxylase